MPSYTHNNELVQRDRATIINNYGSKNDEFFPVLVNQQQAELNKGDRLQVRYQGTEHANSTSHSDQQPPITHIAYDGARIEDQQFLDDGSNYWDTGYQGVPNDGYSMQNRLAYEQEQYAPRNWIYPQYENNQYPTTEYGVYPSSQVGSMVYPSISNQGYNKAPVQVVRKVYQNEASSSNQRYNEMSNEQATSTSHAHHQSSQSPPLLYSTKNENHRDLNRMPRSSSQYRPDDSTQHTVTQMKYRTPTEPVIPAQLSLSTQDQSELSDQLSGSTEDCDTAARSAQAPQSPISNENLKIDEFGKEYLDPVDEGVTSSAKVPSPSTSSEEPKWKIDEYGEEYIDDGEEEEQPAVSENPSIDYHYEMALLLQSKPPKPTTPAISLKRRQPASATTVTTQKRRKVVARGIPRDFMPYEFANALNAPVHNWLNTTELVQRLKIRLNTINISQGVFAENILGRSQGTLSDLMRDPKDWNQLRSGKEVFGRIYNWLNLDEQIAMELCWLEKEDAAIVTGHRGLTAKQMEKKKMRKMEQYLNGPNIRKCVTFTSEQKEIMNYYVEPDFKLPPTRVIQFFADRFQISIGSIKMYFQNSRRRVQRQRENKENNC